MNFDRKQFANEELISIYKKILLPRLIEEKMLVLLRQGKISKWFSGIGQEAIAVGCTYALNQDEWIMPLHRNLGVFTARNIPLHKLFMQWQGNKDGFSKGRERSFHFGTKEYHICGMISHLGPQLGIADGVALAYKLKHGSKGSPLKISLAFTGEGGTSEGDFHEALNVAAVWDLPVIFIVENNGYALSTPVDEQYRCESIVDKAKGYGMEGVRIDGNNILTVIDTVKGVREYCIKNQKPYLIECMTFRMRGHEEASGTKYIPKELFEQWALKDPVVNFENFLLHENALKEDEINYIKEETKHCIERELQIAFKAEPLIPNSEEELNDVYINHSTVNSEQFAVGSRQSAAGSGQLAIKVIDNSKPGTRNPEPATEKRFIDAIKEGLHQSMQRHEHLILMGQDIAEYGGAFKITEGFVNEFGKARVRNTPLCESAIVGCAMGLSLEGFKTVMEMQFADFVTMGFNQIVNNLAKIHYR